MEEQKFPNPQAASSFRGGLFGQPEQCLQTAQTPRRGVSVWRSRRRASGRAGRQGIWLAFRLSAGPGCVGGVGGGGGGGGGGGPRRTGVGKCSGLD